MKMTIFNKYHSEGWAVLALTDKGWAEEGFYYDKKDAKQALKEYQNENPKCYIRMAKVNIKENDNE